MSEKVMKRILAIDYGAKRIGLALSDPLGIFAYPYKTIPNDKNLFNELLNLIKEKQIEKIILGIPSGNSSKPFSIINKVNDFKKQLEEKSGIEVILWDETYTSAIAKRKVLESVPRKSKRRDKGLLDSNSAAIILQEYLEGAHKG
jgi:putative holliday junction resolvase